MARGCEHGRFRNGTHTFHPGWLIVSIQQVRRWKPFKCRNDSHIDESLHLAVSMRSFRAENVSEFVKALLDCTNQRPNSQLKSYSPLPYRDNARLESCKAMGPHPCPRHRTFRPDGLIEGSKT